MRLATDRKQELKKRILALFADDPAAGFTEIAGTVGLSRQTVSLYVRELVWEGRLVVAPDGTHVPASRTSVFIHTVADMPDEDVLYIRDIAPLVRGLPQNVQNALSYGFSEIVNNVIDHAESSELEYSLSLSDAVVELSVRDNGIGIFHKIQRDLGLADPHFSILELSKGKFTSDPEHHSGEGIFFTSRIFDEFSIQSGSLLFVTRQGDGSLTDRDEALGGTEIRMKMALTTTRTPREVFDFYADIDRVPSFYRTQIPLKLMEAEGMLLVSRSQAKRLYARFDQFREVILDFDGVEEIGQGFADELFRVFAREHPQVRLVPQRCAPQVQKMIAHVQG